MKIFYLGFIYPEKRKLAKVLLRIPQKRSQKKLIGFLYPDEILKVFAAVNLIKSDSFRHSCAVRMLSSGLSLSEIRNHLGHEDLQSTTIYLHLDISQKRQIQKQFLDYIQSSLKNDPKLDDLIDWENRQDTLSWLDSL